MYGLDDEFDDGMMFSIIYVLLTYCSCIHLHMNKEIENDDGGVNRIPGCILLDTRYLVYFGTLKKVVRLRGY